MTFDSSETKSTIQSSVFKSRDDVNTKILDSLSLGEEWSAVFTGYQLVDKLGQGSYGCVVKAICKVTGQNVAIKLVKNFSAYEYELVKVVREIQIMKALTKMMPSKMSFFPKLIDLIIPANATVHNLNSIFIVMDHIDTDLSKILKLGNQCKMDKSHVRNICYNLLCALNYLSSANIIHRDIKPANILMNKYCQIRICDFGLARTLP
jgi:mitogen-activated protein kinase 1/3